MSNYDDDGTLMGYMQAFFDGKVFYDGIRSSYGPLYWGYEYFAHKLAGAAISQHSIRMIAVGFWVAASLVLVLFVYRATGSLVLALAAHFCGFRAMAFISAEPAHPQQLCITLLLAMVLAVCARRPIGLACAGVVLACATLTKINFGIIVTTAAGVVLVLALPPGALRRMLAPTAAIGALMVPFAIMTAHLREPWAFHFALLVFLSLLSAIPAAAANRIEPVSGRHLAVAGCAALAAAAAIASFALAHGSTLGGMVWSLIIWPRTHFAQIWYYPLQLPTAAVIWAAACVPLAWMACRGRLPKTLITVLKLTLAGFVVAGIASRHYTELVGAATPMLWLVAIQPRDTSDAAGGSLLRPLLAVLGVLQVLYAYPVAGSQVPFVTLLMVAAAALCVWDVLPWLAEMAPPRAAQIASTAAVAVAIAASGFSAHQAFRRYQSLEPLGLPGARWLRLEPEIGAPLRRLQAAAQPCSVLVGAPSILSLNRFSGKPAPHVDRGIFINAWMTFMSHPVQEAVVREVAAQPHPCVVYNPEILRLFIPGRQSATAPPVTPEFEQSQRESPLMRYILENFRTEFETGGYRFMVRKADP